MKLSILATAAALMLGCTTLASAEAYAPNVESPAVATTASPGWYGLYTGTPFAGRCSPLEYGSSPQAYGSSPQACGDSTGGPVGGPNQS